MSEGTTLTVRAGDDVMVDASLLTPDRLMRLTAAEIAALPLPGRAHAARVGDFFDVRGGHGPALRIEGARPSIHGLGAGMTGGELVIEGNPGDRVAAGMKGGLLRVVGSVGREAGMSMAGGTLVISGDAGDRLGAPTPGAAKGMTGGEIIVGGSAGTDAAARTRRGLIVVRGGVGESAARSMIAGTLIVFGHVGSDPGRNNKRGTIIAIGGITVPLTYRYACTLETGYIRLVMTHLKRHRELEIPDEIVHGRFRRYCGDANGPGKGEILEWTTR